MSKEDASRGKEIFPKGRRCYDYGCNKEDDRAALSVCSKCMIEQYCSRECQVADWSRHEVNCDAYFKTHKYNLLQAADDNIG